MSNGKIKDLNESSEIEKVLRAQISNLQSKCKRIVDPSQMIDECKRLET